MSRSLIASGKQYLPLMYQMMKTMETIGMPLCDLFDKAVVFLHEIQIMMMMMI
jgi:N6-adenosine-specific RNA methylase IME4